MSTNAVRSVSFARIKTSLSVAAVALVAIPIGDFCHISTGTTRYLWSSTPRIGVTAWWFLLPVVLGCVALAEALRPRVSIRLMSTSTDVRSLLCALLVVWAGTALLPHDRILGVSLLAVCIAVGAWFVFDHSKLGLAAGLGTMLAGAIGEIAMISMGAFEYAPVLRTAFGLPPWTLALYFLAGVTVHQIVILTRE